MIVTNMYYSMLGQGSRFEFGADILVALKTYEFASGCDSVNVSHVTVLEIGGVITIFSVG